MAVTVLDIQTDFNSYIGDSSTDRVTQAQRYQYITEATIWLQESLKNDHMIKTYDIQYYDTINYYLVTSPLPDLLDGADLRRRVGRNYQAMAHKSSRELAEEIADGIVGDDAWALERHDDNVYVVINATPQYQATVIDNFDSGVGNWTADAIHSDMTNLRQDTYNYVSGHSSAEYDISLAQSVNNRATMISTDLDLNFAPFQNFGSLLIDCWIPQNAADVTSYTLFWGSDVIPYTTTPTNYWTNTVTTDINGNAFSNENWFTVSFPWIGSTQVGSPNVSNITYFRLDMNYNGSMTNTQGFHYDTFRIANPETLTFYYVSWEVGTNSGGTIIYQYTATTDIPFYSGLYDQYRKAVAHKAASICFADLRLQQESIKEDQIASQALFRAYSIFPSSITKEVKSFSVQGLNFAARNVGRFARRRTIN